MIKVDFRIALVYFLSMVAVSCAKLNQGDKGDVIRKFDTWRKRIRLKAVDDQLKLDSTYYYEVGAPACKGCGVKSVLNAGFGSSYTIREYYSKNLSNNIDFYKEIVWTVDSGRFELDLELDEYTKHDTSGFDVSLRIAIGDGDYGKSKYKTYFEIDTVPRIETELKLLKKFDMLPKDGYWTCGQAYFDLYEGEFPKRHVVLDTTEIELYLSQFLE